MDEKELLSNLPVSIRVDIQKFQFLPIFRRTGFFNRGILYPRIDSSLIFSLFKFLENHIYLPSDLIVIAGDWVEDAYMILEGRVELISFDLRNKVLLQSGDMFGGILEERQYCYARAL